MRAYEIFDGNRYRFIFAANKNEADEIEYDLMIKNKMEEDEYYREAEKEFYSDMKNEYIGEIEVRYLGKQIEEINLNADNI
jgi:hypothetical protein